MENRFGFKDFLLISALTVLIALVVLAMFQFDRQFNRIVRIDEQIAQLTAEQVRIQNKLESLRESIERQPLTFVAPLLPTPPDPTNPPPTPTTQPSHTTATTPPPPTTPDAFHRVAAARASPDYAQGDWLIDAFGANVAKITPMMASDVYGSEIQDRVLESLANRDPVTLQWLPLIAKSWKTSPDGLTITFQLRRNATFSDGHPLTAKDLEFSFNLVNNPQIEAPRERKYYDVIKSVKATDHYQIVFTFREPYFESFEMAATMKILPEHFYGNYTPQQINEQPGLLLGSGPYRMPSPTDWAPGKPLELLRNERYWGQPAAFKKLIYREVNNDSARLTMFRNGDTDVFPAQPEQYDAMVKDPHVLTHAHHFEFERATAGYMYIAWNQNRPGKPTPFANKLVRQAMTMLTDRQAVCDQIMLGYATVSTGPFHRLSKQTDPSVTPWPYDVQRARELLHKAGYIDADNDGVLDSPTDGKPFSFKLTYPAGSEVYERTVLFLKDSYARAGVILQPDPLEWSVFQQKLNSRDFDAISLGWSSGIETDIRQMFHSSQIADGADNFISYASPQLDKLIDQARATVDEADRLPLWQHCHRIIHEDQPYTFLFTRKSLIFIDHRIANVQKLPLGLNDRTEWYVPKAAQKWTK